MDRRTFMRNASSAALAAGLPIPVIEGTTLTIADYIDEIRACGGRIVAQGGCLYIGIPDAEIDFCFWERLDQIKRKYAHLGDLKLEAYRFLTANN